MKYVLIVQSRVSEIIQEIDAQFPGIPIEERYSADVLKNCVDVPDSTDTPIGFVYDTETGEFVAPPPEPIPEVQPDQPVIPGEPTAQDNRDSLAVDHEYRITLLELGVV